MPIIDYYRFSAIFRNSSIRILASRTDIFDLFQLLYRIGSTSNNIEYEGTTLGNYVIWLQLHEQMKDTKKTEQNLLKGRRTIV